MSLIKENNNKFYVYVQRTEISELFDHTGVYLKEPIKYIFTCHGNGPNKDIITKEIEFNGNLKDIIKMICGNSEEIRKNNIYNLDNDQCGIKYGLNGVCHQEVNRILYLSGRMLPILEIKGGLYSHVIYGIYGSNWLEWLNKNNISKDLINNIKPNNDFDEKFLEIAKMNISELNKLKLRIEFVLKRACCYTEERLNLLIKDIEQYYSLLYEISKKTYTEEDVIECFTKVNEMIYFHLKDDYFKVFNMNYDKSFNYIK